MTGCDSVSSFAGHGKITALKTLKFHTEYKSALAELDRDWTPSNALFKELEVFTCHMYSMKTPTLSINELRYQLFCAKKEEVESWQLPPCAAALHKHYLRASYLAAIGRRCLEACPVIPSPINTGWCMVKEGDDEYLGVDWMDAPAAPDAVLRLLSCKCARVCKLPDCPCLINKLKCTELCNLTNCSNQKPETDSLEINYASEDDADDEWD